MVTKQAQSKKESLYRKRILQTILKRIQEVRHGFLDFFDRQDVISLQ